MTCPDDLATDAPLLWSAGRGTDVWDLFCACIAGDLDAVERLIAKDPSLVRAHYEYRTPLSLAVRENKVSVAAFLLDRGADPIALGDLLQVARDRGCAEMEQLLTERTLRLHGASAKGEPVAAAIRDRDITQMNRLLDASPDLLHAGDSRSNQPIHWAVMTRQLKMIDALLARGADINARRQDGARPVQLVNGDYHFRGWRDVPKLWTTSPAKVLAHLQARGAYVDIATASQIGDVTRVRELLAEDPAVANRTVDYVSYYAGSGTPLQNAAGGGHMEIVTLLLDHGADPNLPEEGIAPHGRALYSAVYHRHYEIAKLLLERGAYANPEVESSADALSIAIMNSDERMVALLASHGATWNIPVELAG